MFDRTRLNYTMTISTSHIFLFVRIYINDMLLYFVCKCRISF